MWAWLAVVVAGWLLGNVLAFGHAVWNDWKVLREVNSVDGSQWVVAVATFWGVAIVGCKSRFDADILFKNLHLYRALINTRRHTQGLKFTIVLERGVLFGVLRTRVIGALIEDPF